MDVEIFKSDLKNLDSIQMYRKFVLNESCCILNSDQHYQLRDSLSNKFKVEFTDVVVVGSTKLGFSIKKEKMYVAFGETSDIDVAIVSTSLFEMIWREAYLYKKSGVDWPNSGAFFEYLAKGWIRPDKLPKSNLFSFTNTWWDYFNELTNSQKFGPYPIRAGLYHSHFFLKEYQIVNIERCIRGIEI